MEEKLDIYDIITIILLIVNVLNFFIFIRVQRDIAEFNKRQEQVNEYVINKVEK